MKKVYPIIYFVFALTITFLISYDGLSFPHRYGFRLVTIVSLELNKVIVSIIKVALFSYFFFNMKEIIKKIPLHKFLIGGIYSLLILSVVDTVFVGYLQTQYLLFYRYTQIIEVLIKYLGLSLILYAVFVIVTKYTSAVMKVTICLMVVGVLFMHNYVLLNSMMSLMNYYRPVYEGEFMLRYTTVISGIVLLMYISQLIAMLTKNKR
ncbi:hypothetical protein KQ51_00833 [Candidatus Izimaplasma bacterium HR1]|jgi:hypothetical protein|uniref:hypothetical protein n=1 Tax=Candidatus Izimoplasma sp. HR1 TaxID=1541959 RepID=UPI0004F6D72A|nr:hypothetical protein KQ51_00833 [Candidatus Izimaplasma bacterium HR1]